MDEIIDDIVKNYCVDREKCCEKDCFWCAIEYAYKKGIEDAKKE